MPLIVEFYSEMKRREEKSGWRICENLEGNTKEWLGKKGRKRKSERKGRKEKRERDSPHTKHEHFE